MAGRPSQPNGVPFPGAAWAAEGCLPGALIAAVEADPLRGERCPHCRRTYGGEEEADTEQRSCVTVQDVLQLLVEAARGQKTSRDRQVGRWVHLLAFYMGILPGCSSDAEVAQHLNMHPRALSESKKRLPPAFQALCRLQHRPRKRPRPELNNSDQTLDSIADSLRQHGPDPNWIP